MTYTITRTDASPNSMAAIRLLQMLGATLEVAASAIWTAHNKGAATIDLKVDYLDVVMLPLGYLATSPKSASSQSTPRFTPRRSAFRTPAPR
jgi:hypothetical protein